MSITRILRNFPLRFRSSTTGAITITWLIGVSLAVMFGQPNDIGRSGLQILGIFGVFAITPLLFGSGLSQEQDNFKHEHLASEDQQNRQPFGGTELTLGRVGPHDNRRRHDTQKQKKPNETPIGSS